MENNSASPISQEWPTHWKPNAFSPAPTAIVLVGIAALVFIISFVALWAYMSATGTPLAIIRQHPPLRFALLGQFVLDVAAIIYFAFTVPWLAKRPLRDIGFRRPDGNTLAAVVLGAFAMVLVVDLLASVIESALGIKHEQNVVAMFTSITDPGLKLFVAFFAVVVAPIAEEFMFRIFAFNVVLKHANFWVAAIVSGALFGLSHGDAFAFVPLALGGVILCAVYYRTRNAWAPMMVHGLFNSVTVIALYLPHASALKR